jgi:hypothetical protein
MAAMLTPTDARTALTNLGFAKPAVVEVSRA